MMKKNTWLYSGLIVLVLVLVGVGIGLVLNPSDPVKMPKTDPWITADTVYLEQGVQTQLLIFDDGTVIQWDDTGLPGSLSPEDTPERVWRTGKLDSGDMDDLSELLDTVDFNILEEYYLSPVVSVNGTLSIEDNYYKISVAGENTVTAHGYFTPAHSSAFYPMPDPVDEIREYLTDIVENNTKEVLTEEIIPD